MACGFAAGKTRAQSRRRPAQLLTNLYAGRAAIQESWSSVGAPMACTRGGIGGGGGVEVHHTSCVELRKVRADSRQQ
jgi:hypothetical protein